MNLVRELRERAGLTQVLLARLSGVSRPAISRYENGHVSPSLETLQRLAAPTTLDVVVSLREKAALGTTVEISDPAAAG